MIYFTADLHIHHKDAVQHTRRPFSGPEEMDRVLAENWNRRVQPQDEVYLLGDLTLKSASRAERLLRSLNGRKYLLRGNHDRFAGQETFPHELFVWVKDYYELHQGDQWLILCHYPLLDWNHRRYGSLHLHGHLHSRREDNKKNRSQGLLRYDVGVDANGFSPVSLEEILTFFAKGSSGRLVCPGTESWPGKESCYGKAGDGSE